LKDQPPEGTVEGDGPGGEGSETSTVAIMLNATAKNNERHPAAAWKLNKLPKVRSQAAFFYP
jgi:hypothetical protein